MLLQIDDLTRPDHAHLREEDECYFVMEYTSRVGYNYSPANSLISNLKKRPSLKGTPQWKYKTTAIDNCGRELKRALNPDWLKGVTLVPIPPSRVKSDPEHDDRMTQILRSLGSYDVRELIEQTETTRAAHLSGDGERLSVRELISLYRVNEKASRPPPLAVALFDDVLTNGTHFVAAKTVLQTRFPGVDVVGIFVARRVFPPTPFGE